MVFWNRYILFMQWSCETCTFLWWWSSETSTFSLLWSCETGTFLWWWSSETDIFYYDLVKLVHFVVMGFWNMYIFFKMVLWNRYIFVLIVFVKQVYFLLMVLCKRDVVLHGSKVFSGERDMYFCWWSCETCTFLQCPNDGLVRYVHFLLWWFSKSGKFL